MRFFVLPAGQNQLRAGRTPLVALAANFADDVSLFGAKFGFQKYPFPMPTQGGKGRIHTNFENQPKTTRKAGF